MTPAFRFAHTVAFVLAIWVAAAGLIALLKDEPFRFLPGDAATGLLMLAALLFGAALRFVIDSRSARKSHG